MRLGREVRRGIVRVARCGDAPGRDASIRDGPSDRRPGQAIETGGRAGAGRDVRGATKSGSRGGVRHLGGGGLPR
ncbi:MAG: hypothetical protein CMJ48_05455, partial [Planctomycetaceae bacterium]|nr:hypothetical protein [Planctomycetaceae bacterium]